MQENDHPRRRIPPAGWLAATGVALALVTTACVSAPTAQIPQPTSVQRAVAAAAGYELGPVRDADEILPPEIVAGPHHSVNGPVVTVGNANHYLVSSEFGDYAVLGDDQLYIRIREIEALAALDRMSKTAEFARAAGKALTSPFVATWNLITDPVDSILGVPLKAWEKVRSTAQLARGERGRLEGSGLGALIGFEEKKRTIANQLDVDPYSSNKRLQTQLNRFTWAAYAGGLPFMLVPFTETDEDEEDVGDRLSDILLRYSPEDLRRLNRIELAVMGIPEPLRKEFITHPWYSPSHHTVLVESLAALDLTENRAAFIETAVSAESELDARTYQRTAELLRAYGDHVAPLRRIVAVDGALLAYAKDGALVLPITADYAVWSPETAALAESLKSELPAEIEVTRRELLVSGAVSPLAREHLEALDISVTEHALETLGAAPEQTAEATEAVETAEPN
jgi:hypothetical protein